MRGQAPIILPLILCFFTVEVWGDLPLAPFIHDFCRRHSIRYFSLVSGCVSPKDQIHTVKQLMAGPQSTSSLYLARFLPNIHPNSLAKTLNIALKNSTFSIKGDLDQRMRFKLAQDFWLVQLDGNEEMADLLQDLPLDLDDEFYVFSMTTTDQIVVYEAYKLQAAMKPRVLYFGTWTVEGFIVSNSDKWDRRGDLRGLSFRISAASSIPYTKVDEQSDGQVELSGMYPDIFFSLKSMLNFTFTIILPEEREEWGTKNPDGSWTGVIGQIQRKEIDFSPISFTRTKLRSEVVDFALPIAQFHHRFFVQNPKNSFNWLAYLEPLTLRVWLTIFLLTLILPPFLTFLAFMPWTRKESERSEFTLWKSFIFVLGALTLARGWSVTPIRARNRVIFLAIILGGSVVFWHWEAMIISYLAVRVPALPFQDLEGLLSKTNKKILVKPGSSYVDGFRYSLDPLIQEAWQSRIKDYLDTYPNSRRDLTDLVASDPDYVLYDNFYSSRTFDAYRRCKIIAVPKVYEKKVFAYAFQRDSPFLPLFNFNLKRMLERGSMNQVVEKYLSVAGQQCEDLSGAPLGFENCFTAFLVFLTGCFLGAVVGMAEHLAKCFGPKGTEVLNRDYYDRLSQSDLVQIVRQRDEALERLLNVVHEDSDPTQGPNIVRYLVETARNTTLTLPRTNPLASCCRDHRDPIHHDVEVLEVCAPDFSPKLCLGGIHDVLIARRKPSKTLCPLIQEIFNGGQGYDDGYDDDDEEEEDGGGGNVHGLRCSSVRSELVFELC
eukprot:maker-scaffold455_size166772-snap-gene-0.36 protein:Tk12527 transcript:maker-scaffold455_size166772-snap-gene-0.36-mRNA-1 annotation:"hypothetical protein L798_01404"